MLSRAIESICFLVFGYLLCIFQYSDFTMFKLGLWFVGFLIVLEFIGGVLADGFFKFLAKNATVIRKGK